MTSQEPQRDPGTPEGEPPRDPEAGRVLSIEERIARRRQQVASTLEAGMAAMLTGAPPPDTRARRAERERERLERQRERERERLAREADRLARQRRDRREAERRAAEEAAAAEAARRMPPTLGGVRPGDGLAPKAPAPAPVLGAAPAPAPVPALRPGRPAPGVPAPRARDAGLPDRPRPAKPAPREAEEGPNPFAGQVRPPAAPARARARHWIGAISFVLLVILPTAVAAWYLWTRAADRYASYVGFSIRSEDMGSALELMGGMTALTGGASSANDSDILYDYIRSQEIVANIDEKLDLRAIWAKGDPERDPVFAYRPPGSIEDLHDYWNRMVQVYQEGSTGILNVQVQAFTPEDAQAIAQAIFDQGTTLINQLSDTAREDATRYARAELDAAEERLRQARAAMTRFRNDTQMVDPVSAVQSQMGLLSQLEGELAQTLIELDLLQQTAPDGDPRVSQAEARRAVIEDRIAAERTRLGLGTHQEPGAEGPAAGPAGPGGAAFADLVGQYESLFVDQEFASTAYTAARTAYDSALAESQRQSRYLAAHIRPTLAQTSEHPARVTLTLLTFGFALLAWTILTLGAYAFRDRR